MNQTVANFDAALITFKNNCLAGYSYNDQMDYLRSIRKPKEVSPSEFLSLLRTNLRIATQLPQAPAVPQINDDELKRIYVKAMPQSWQDKFEDANMRVADEAIDDIKVYFDTQHNKDPYNPPNNNNNNNSSGSNRFNRRGNGNGRGNGNSGG